jgi:F-type H+-transporting ATPase subunit b
MKRVLGDRPDRSFSSRCLNKANVASVAFVFCLFLCVALSYASGGEGEAEGGRNWHDFFWRAFDFAVLAGFLYWLFANKAKDFFSGRRKAIRTALEKAAADKEEAERKFREYDDKLKKAADELKSMMDIIQSQGLAEKERIIADALKVAGKLKEDAQKRVEQEMNRARKELRAEAVRLSVKMAEEILKEQITAGDHAVMVEDYIDKVVTKH